jgi:hypothetical protein
MSCLHRYLTKKALDNTAASLVEELLERGRGIMTVNAVGSTAERLHLQESSSSAAFPDSKVASRQAVLESLRRLVGGGFIEQVNDRTLSQPGGKRRIRLGKAIFRSEWLRHRIGQ